MRQASKQTDAALERSVMTTAEAATYLRISRRTLGRRAAGGEIGRCDISDPDRPGRAMWRYLRDDLDAYLRSRESRKV